MIKKAYFIFTTLNNNADFLSHCEETCLLCKLDEANSDTGTMIASVAAEKTVPSQKT